MSVRVKFTYEDYLELETVKVYRMAPQGYSRVAELNHEASDTLSTPLLPELSIPLTDLFT